MNKCILLFSIVLPLKAWSFTASELFDQLREHNRMVAEEKTRLESVKASASTVWTPPEVAISEMNDNTPFFDSKMKMQRSVEVSQMFPNPWRLSAGNDLKEHTVKAQTLQIEETFKKVKREGYALFLELYKNVQEASLNSARKTYLEKFLSRLQSAQVQGQEERLQVAEVQTELVELKILLDQNKNERERIQRMLNQMMGRDLDKPIDDPVLGEIRLNPEIQNGKNSELQNLNGKIAVMESEISMKKSEFFPELSLKARINKSYSDKIDNSKELMVGITLPFLFFGQQSGEAEAARYKAEAMKHFRSGLESEIEMKKANLKSEIEDLEKALKFLKETSLPIREKKLKLYNNYSYVDMKTLMNFKMSIDDYYMLKMKLLEKEVDQQKKYFEWTELYL